MKNGYTIYRCTSCGLAMTDLGRPYKAFVKEHYTDEYFTGDPRRSAYVNYEQDKPFIVKNFRKYFDRITKWKTTGKFLDVGCALGYGVEMANALGFDAYGFDPSSYATGRAKALVGDKRIKTGTIDDVTYAPDSFNVITLFDVFEHLDDPRKDLAKLKNLLTKDGILIIATGDTSSFLAKVLKRRWTFYIPPQHLFFFSRATLSTLLRQLGFEPLEWFRISKWLSTRYVFHLARTTGESRIARLLYPIVYKSALGAISLYLPVRDNMVVIARKL
ncbi:hypothetical protein A2971_04175 [Candidatus Gottesmanbacteria bacterium RIFCSPLOWO2_01_FULL_46_21]|uniref:Methyltransferase type 11 domain-containing protein n=2 Tax=Microgenomates group TaxID=1794810 RepID=A0A1F6AZ16_9BACT|nr:MAG: hypothetical protein A2971_04175 [Candidatus Gottesmanbacteria bacterium RIFCSPLOWO2_01_FULL_46_21]